jgi:hypothetical protein
MEHKDLFEYSEDSPSGLVWKIDRFSGRGYKRRVAWAGATAGSLDDHGYFTVPFNKRNTRCHLIVASLHGMIAPSGSEIDHADQNKVNNRIENLRIVSKTVNLRNKVKYSNNKTGMTGVYRYTTTQKGVERHYFVAQWAMLDGLRKVKRFSIAKHGEAAALQLASDHRLKMINELNLLGAGYTPVHGT